MLVLYLNYYLCNFLHSALGINLLGLFVLMGMTYFCGLVIFATYFTCDPILTKVNLPHIFAYLL